ATEQGETLSWPTAAGLTVLRLAAHSDTATVDPRWIRGSPDPVNYGIALWYEAGLFYAATGDPQRAGEALDTLEALGAGDGWLIRGLLRAATAAAAGDPESLDALRAAESGCRFTGRDYRFFPLMRGRILEAMGRTGEAAAAYEEWLAARPLFAKWDAVFLFDTLERLGLLHQRLGHRTEAARYYARAAELWQDADPALQPRVRHLREKAAALMTAG
ncbi:MAG: hypothetical protein P8099_18560, partial [Gemmatimonadota bacterium]